MAGKKTKSARQVRAIFANADQKTKDKLAKEIRTGKVKIKKKK